MENFEQAYREMISDVKECCPDTNRWALVKCVVYDGIDAYIVKFIVNKNHARKTTEDKIKAYCDGNGEILKIDELYGLSVANIIAMGMSDNDDDRCAFKRWCTMYLN